MLSLSLPPCPHKPTDRSKGEQQQGRRLGDNCVGVIAAPSPVAEEQAKLGRQRLSSLSLLALPPTLFFSENSQISTKIKNQR
jgi:hypothetical protein